MDVDLQQHTEENNISRV